MLDLFMIKCELEYNGYGIDGLYIVMIGDLCYGWIVYFLFCLLCLFKNICFMFILLKELVMF